MHAALGLPEIQYSFCQFLAPSDAAALVRTSHAFFHPAVEHLWGTTNVPLRYLLALLDGVTVEHKKYLRIRLPDGSSEAHLSRFPLYAPYVKHLVCDFSSGPNENIPNYEHITSMAKSRVLLPNLLTLRVVGAEEEDQLRHYFELLKQLISPSLRALKIYKFASWDLRQFSGVLIRKAVSKCPRLNLLWMTSPIPVTGGPLPVPLYVEDLTIHPHNVTLAVLEWIAAMPCLKTLQIGGRRSIVTRSWELDACPPSAYASLRSLTVTFLGTQSATYFWSLTLVKNLSFVRIMFRRFHSTAIPNALEFFSLLAKRSPNLTSLSLVFMHASWESSIFLFPTRLLSHLSPISLDFLEINGAQLDAEGANAFSQIAQLWPSLCTLNLRNHPATLSDLAIISASFSRLSHLSLTLAAELPPGKDNSTPPIQHFGQPLTFQTPFVFISALSVSEQDDFALYLARLWKNARCVHPRKNKAYAKFLNRLNARILDYSREIVE